MLTTPMRSPVIGSGMRRYRKLFELGHGGMADVWLGLRNGLGGFRKLVVVKMLRDNLVDNAQLREMLLDEARIAARLNHPNVVQTLEVGEQDGEFFIVMEFLEGQSLKAIRRQKPMPLNMELTAISNVLSGLEYAHKLCDFDGSELCLVHRDVSPDNVFVTYDGHVKLVDFGVAKTRMSTSVTTAGHFKGKLAYMPPEQAYNHGVDHRADLFAVGVMLWEAIQGARMWENVPDVTVLHLLGTGAIPKLAEVCPGAPIELVQICGRALAPNKDSRYASAEEFRADIQRYLANLGGPVDARLIGAHISGAFTKERRRITAAIEAELGRVAHRPMVPPPPALGAAPVRGPTLAAPDPYGITRPIGNADGEVYEGVHHRLDRKVQIEFSREHSDVEALVESLRPRAALIHPNTVRILHVENIEQSSDIVVIREHVDGTTLHSLFAETGAGSGAEVSTLGPMRVIGLGIQVLLSLCEAHSHGICHGHLDPTGIFLCRNSGGGEHVKVAGYEGDILPGMHESSRRYQAPEVLAGKKADSASDVFSLGLILYESLTGVHPFHDGDDVKSAYRQMHDELPKSEEGKGARILEIDGLREWLERALSKNPAGRFSDAQEMLAAASAINSDALAQLTQETSQAGLDGSLVRADYDVVFAPTEVKATLHVNRNTVASLTRPSVWVLAGDPAIRSMTVTIALAELQERVDLRVLAEDECGEIGEQLQAGTVLPPWVVVFGDLHVILGERLLFLLADSAEVSRILISTHANAEMLQETVNACGLDQQVCLPAEATELTDSIDLMIARALRQRAHYDRLRQTLLDGREQRSALTSQLVEGEREASGPV